MVADDYSDLLAVTLPYNRHHFDEVLVVTGPRDRQARELCLANDAEYIVTELFWEGGARFNKWAALEHGLDRMGREGWLCVMDADVLWPRGVRVAEYGQSLRFGLTDGRGDMILNRGELMTPLRRMAPWPLRDRQWDETRRELVPFELTDEKMWDRWPIHRNVAEWAGYSQVFHANDPVLGPAPWHETDWSHAGGADSLFQRKWTADRKRRPPWEVLHLGEPGRNWYGRATAYATGEVPVDAAEKGRLIDGMWEGRRERRRAGMSEAEQFRPEKLS